MPADTKPFSTEAFLEFARSKPADEAYDNVMADCCALAQFGYPHAVLSTHRAMGISEAVYEAAVCCRGDRTFGGLVRRLEAVLAEQVRA